MNNEGVDILDVDDDNDFKDTGKWKDRSRAWFEKIKSNELIPQLAFEVNEQYELVLILETILKKDKYEHEMDSFETLGRKYLWFKDINELNLLFCLCNEQLCDEDTKNKLMLWTDLDLVKEEKGLIEFLVLSKSKTLMLEKIKNLYLLFVEDMLEVEIDLRLKWYELKTLHNEEQLRVLNVVILLWQFLNLNVDEDDSLEDSFFCGLMLMLKESLEVNVTRDDRVDWSSLLCNEKLDWPKDEQKDKLGGEKVLW